MKIFLLGILILGTFTGIFPILAVAFLSKHIVLAVITGIIALGLIAKELCF